MSRFHPFTSHTGSSGPKRGMGVGASVWGRSGHSPQSACDFWVARMWTLLPLECPRAQAEPQYNG